VQEAAAAQMLQEEMYAGDMRSLSQSLTSSPSPTLLRGTQQPPQQASSSQQQEPLLAGTPKQATPNDLKEAVNHQADKVRSTGDGQQEQQDKIKSTGVGQQEQQDKVRSTGDVEARTGAQETDQADKTKSTGDREKLGSAKSSVRSATGTPKEGVRVRLPSTSSRASTPASGESGASEPPVKDEPPYNLELLLPYASLTQVRHFVSATDKYGCTPVDVAATSGHIHLAQLLNQFLVNKA